MSCSSSAAVVQGRLNLSVLTRYHRSRTRTLYNTVSCQRIGAPDRVRQERTQGDIAVYSLFGPDPEFEKWLNSASSRELVDRLLAMASMDGSLLEFTMIVDRVSAVLPDSDPWFYDVQMKIGRCWQNSDARKAGVHFRRGADSALKYRGAASAEYFAALEVLGQSMLSSRGPAGPAKKVFQELLHAQELAFGKEDARLLSTLDSLQWCQFLMYGWDKKPLVKQVEERDQIIKRAIALCLKSAGPSSLLSLKWKVIQAEFWAEEHSIGTASDAKLQLEAVLSLIESNQIKDRYLLSDCCRYLADILDAEGRQSESQRIKDKIPQDTGDPFSADEFAKLHKDSIKSAIKFHPKE